MAKTRAGARLAALPFTEALAAVSKFIESLDQPAAVIGGIAAIAHGFARATTDIDLAVAVRVLSPR